MQCAADAAANNAPSRFASGEACCFLLREGYIFSCFGAGIWFLCFGRIRCFPISGRAHSSCVEEGRVFSASGKAHCFPASGGRHSFNLGGAQGLSCFDRGAFLFWGMAYCFRPRRCALVNPCAYEGLPRLRNRSARVSFAAVRRVRRLYAAPRAASCGRCRGRWRACVLCAPP